MSRLDSFLRRLTAQRACLDEAGRLMERVAGPAWELGLGSGRSYDHLRHQFPARDIFVFERLISDDAAGMVPADRLVIGDMRETLGPAGRDALPASCRAPALVHVDIGSGDAAVDAMLARFLGGALPGLMAAGGIVVADRELPGDLEPLLLPAGVATQRYFIFRNSI